ncbi:MAG: helix-hairpin-helix domain-containing protein [Wenzhouxiangella sp.]|jgi:competence protein ComEA|nr:helix-hairpin-helix domain-containing protein [Wenzhouxiangella sp.]
MFKKMIAAVLIALALNGFALAEEPTIDINTATAEQLAEFLSGVGEAKAEAIIQYREEHGAFTHPDELVNVRGIGLATVDRNRDRIVVKAPAESQR